MKFFKSVFWRMVQHVATFKMLKNWSTAPHFFLFQKKLIWSYQTKFCNDPMFNSIKNNLRIDLPGPGDIVCWMSFLLWWWANVNWTVEQVPNDFWWPIWPNGQICSNLFEHLLLWAVSKQWYPETWAKTIRPHLFRSWSVPLVITAIMVFLLFLFFSLPTNYFN